MCSAIVLFGDTEVFKVGDNWMTFGLAQFTKDKSCHVTSFALTSHAITLTSTSSARLNPAQSVITATLLGTFVIYHRKSMLCIKINEGEKKIE